MICCLFVYNINGCNFYNLSLIFSQGMFQETAESAVLQHDAVHIQHGDDDEGESQHPFLIPDETEHGSVR